jgi:hypothetical protein
MVGIAFSVWPAGRYVLVKLLELVKLIVIM